MKLKHFISLLSLGLALSITAGAEELRQGCAKHLLPNEVLGFEVRDLERKINADLGPGGLYRSILSTDLQFLNDETKIDGPGAQRNMRIERPEKQFRFNAEARSIFELKKRLLARNPGKILGVASGHEKTVKAAVLEQFEHIYSEFPKTQPQAFRIEGDTLVNLLTGDRLSRRELSRMDATEGLKNLGYFVPDDLLFMKKVGSEYLLIGGNLASPTRWSIGPVLGASITEIHAYVTGTPKGPGEFAGMINRILDRTLGSVDVPCRNNWFMETDPRYSIPRYLRTEYKAPAAITRKNYAKSVFIRTERQSLRGLPKSQTVVFGIQPFVFPLAAVLSDRGTAEEVIRKIRTKFTADAGPRDFNLRIAKYLEEDLGPDPRRIETKVIALDQINASTFSLSVEKPPGTVLVAGEAVRVTLDTPSGPETRTLSLANSPDAATLEFATKVSDSAFKKAFKALAPGTKVRLELMRTSLEFDTSKPMVMIAGGIGITPFRSVIQQVQEKSLGTPMWLLYGNRDEIAFGDELDTAAARGSNLEIDHVLSRPDAAWAGTRGRIDKAYLRTFVASAPADAKYYVVASPEMTRDVQDALREFGIPDDRISTEAFVGSAEGKANPVLDPKSIKDCDLVCYCYRVNAGQLRSAVRSGADTIDALQAATGAGTGCGGCMKNIMSLLQCELSKIPD